MAPIVLRRWHGLNTDCHMSVTLTSPLAKIKRCHLKQGPLLNSGEKDARPIPGFKCVSGQPGSIDERRYYANKIVKPGLPANSPTPPVTFNHSDVSLTLAKSALSCSIGSKYLPKKEEPPTSLSTKTMLHDTTNFEENLSASIPFMAPQHLPRIKNVQLPPQ
eukprot:scaffold42338_cov160-Amphora_coffeaeformis.AAC.1